MQNQHRRFEKQLRVSCGDGDGRNTAGNFSDGLRESIEAHGLTGKAPPQFLMKKDGADDLNKCLLVVLGRNRDSRRRGRQNAVQLRQQALRGRLNARLTIG